MGLDLPKEVLLGCAKWNSLPWQPEPVINTLEPKFIRNWFTQTVQATNLKQNCWIELPASTRFCSLWDFSLGITMLWASVDWRMLTWKQPFFQALQCMTLILYYTEHGLRHQFWGPKPPKQIWSLVFPQSETKSYKNLSKLSCFKVNQVHWFAMSKWFLHPSDHRLGPRIWIVRNTELSEACGSSLTNQQGIWSSKGSTFDIFQDDKRQCKLQKRWKSWKSSLWPLAIIVLVIIPHHYEYDCYIILIFYYMYIYISMVNNSWVHICTYHKIRIWLWLCVCVTIINSVMAISNPKIGSCSIPRYPKLQAQEPLLEACSVFAPGVATIVTCGSKHTMSIQCDTHTSPAWNHLARDAQDVSELGFPFFNMTSLWSQVADGEVLTCHIHICAGKSRFHPKNQT